MVIVEISKQVTPDVRSSLRVLVTLQGLLAWLVCPLLREPDKDFHRLTWTDFEAMKKLLQHRSLVLDAGLVEEDCADCVKSRLVEYSWNNSERLLARSHNRARGQTLSCSLSVISLAYWQRLS